MKTLSWDPVPGALSYQIQQEYTNGEGQVLTQTFNVPATQTTLQVPVQFKQVFVTLWYGQAQPRPPMSPVAPYVQFGSFSYYGLLAPQPIQWDSFHYTLSTAGNGSVTISFWYSPPSIAFFSGALNSDTVSVAVHPGGQTITTPIQGQNGGLGVIDTFTGLTNGIPYYFTSTASDICGTSGEATSPLYTPRAPGGLYCVVTGVSLPPTVPAAQQTVQVLAADGLASISNIQVVNGTVSAPQGLPPGVTDPVNVTATKTDPSKRTVWSFDMTDVNGKTKHCS